MGLWGRAAGVRAVLPDGSAARGRLVTAATAFLDNADRQGSGGIWRLPRFHRRGRFRPALVGASAHGAHRQRLPRAGHVARPARPQDSGSAAQGARNGWERRVLGRHRARRPARRVPPDEAGVDCVPRRTDGRGRPRAAALRHQHRWRATTEQLLFRHAGVETCVGELIRYWSRRVNTSRGHPRRLPVGRRLSILCSWVETWGTSPGARLRDHFFSMLLQSFARLLRRCITMVVYGKHFHVGITEPRNDFSPEYAFSCSLFLWRAPPWSSVGLGLGALFSRPQARSIEDSLSLARILSMASSSCDGSSRFIF